MRSGEFREDAAYSVARELLQQPDPPTALYVANGVMALGVMRAIADLGLRCPEDISIASTDTIPGHRRPEAAAHPDRASGRRHDQRSGAPARRPHQPRRRNRTAQRRLPARAGRRRQLRAMSRLTPCPKFGVHRVCRANRQFDIIDARKQEKVTFGSVAQADEGGEPNLEPR